MDELAGVFDDLMALVAVVEAGGFNAASSRFDIPVSRLSRRVAALEKKMGVSLLMRTARRFKVTEIGQRTYEHGLAIRAEMQNTMAGARASLDEPGGHLRISCPMALGTSIVGPLAIEFMTRHPRVSITLESTDGQLVAFSDPVDLMIQPSKEPLRDSSLVARKLVEARYLLVAAPAVAAALHAVSEAPDWPTIPAIGWTFFAPQAGRWQLQHADGAELEIPVQTRFTSDNLLLVRQAALAGMGVAQLPPVLCAADIRAGHLSVVAPGWSPPAVSIYAIYPSRRVLTLAGRSFVDALGDAFAQLGQATA
jgi:DNA-binding transcriptional LysR family regulator